MCHRLQVEAIQVEPLARNADGAEGGDRIQSPKRRVLNENRTMDNVDIC
jgi:hypothetical protein